MTTRMERINMLADQLRELYADELMDWEIAEKYGCKVADLDKFDIRIGGSIRDLAKSNMERWGEW